MATAKPAPQFNTWRVVGGGSSGGLVVRASAKTSSQESEKRLQKGSLVQELEVQGERLRFRLLSGSGPPTGWVSTKLKGKDLLVQRPLKVGLSCTGSRGDVQPLIALGKGLQREGCEVVIFAHTDYEDFVKGNALAYVPMLDPLITESEPDENDAAAIELLEARLYLTRYLASQCHKCPIAGVSAKEDMRLKVTPVNADLLLLSMGVCYELAVAQGDDAKAKEVGDHFQSVMAAREALAQAPADGAGTPGQPSGGASGTAPPAPTEPPSHEGSGQPAEAGPRPQQPEQPAQGTGGPEQEEDPYLQFMRLIREDPVNTMQLHGICCSLISTFFQRPDDARRFWEELETNPPDVVLFHWGMGQLMGAVFEAKFGIPTVPYNLYANVDASDPTGEWLTEEIWQALVRPLELAGDKGETLAEARQKLKDSNDRPGWPFVATEMGAAGFRALAALDAVLLEPLFGTRSLQHIGHKAWSKKVVDENIVGFLSSVKSPNVLRLLGKKSKAEAEKHHYVGFWMMSAEEQTTGLEEFGGTQVLREVEAFLASGSKPVYIGWGSMSDFHRGRHMMVVLAVSALKELGERGIILGGWSKLSYELLEEAVGKDDAAGLCEYARKNVLFLAKAPQAWLFPKCAAIVIHGGSGTMAAAWASGVPVVVVPVTVDQPGNGLLNMALGGGICTRKMCHVHPPMLAQAIRTVLTSPEIRRGAQVVQVGMVRDKSVTKAHELVLDFLARSALDPPLKSVRRMAGEIFDRFDQDGDGYLNQDEVAAMVAIVAPGTEISAECMVELCCYGREAPTAEERRRGPSRQQILWLYDDPQCRDALGGQDGMAPDAHLHHALVFGGWRKEVLDKAGTIFDHFDRDGDGLWNKREVREWLSTCAGPCPQQVIDEHVLPALRRVGAAAGWFPASPEEFERGVPRRVVVELLTDIRHQGRVGDWYSLDVEEMYEKIFQRS